MAAMFREAEAEAAVLLLDEADRFLQDRRGAQRSCEVTEVNEMLQGLERYKGIFICTTKLLYQLCPGDFAAVKRQALILDTQLPALEFLAQLEAEHRIKPEVRENRGMGFLQ